MDDIDIYLDNDIIKSDTQKVVVLGSDDDISMPTNEYKNQYEGIKLRTFNDYSDKDMVYYFSGQCNLSGSYITYPKIMVSGSYDYCWFN